MWLPAWSEPITLRLGLHNSLQTRLILFSCCFSSFVSSSCCLLCRCINSSCSVSLASRSLISRLFLKILSLFSTHLICAFIRNSVKVSGAAQVTESALPFSIMTTHPTQIWCSARYSISPANGQVIRLITILSPRYTIISLISRRASVPAL